VTRLKLDKSQRLLTSSPAMPVLNSQPSTLNRLRAFTLIEILVVVVLMSFIVLALMAVFNSTQAAFRASLTQTDVLEGGRAVMGLIKSDLESMAPSFGQSNQPAANGYSTVPVNFYANTNFNYQPLVQLLAGSGYQRTNVLEEFFILTRQNTTWTGIGYVVDTTSTDHLNPLYRFTMSTNVMTAGPAGLYYNFLTNRPAWTKVPISSANASFSHLMDGVVHLTVRAYDNNGQWMTNTVEIYNGRFATNRNVCFLLPATLGETGFYMFSNTLPASVEIELGVLEDRTIQRAESLPNVAPVWASSNYLSQRAGQVHLFRQRFPIRNVDPSAYQ
jgi:type II secretory pathway pseudopilin PulG